MTSEEIDRDQWIAFTNRFSRSHDGWSASLELWEAGAPPRVEVDDSPFRGVTFEARDGRDTLVLTFGFEPEEHFAHIVHDPFAIAAAETGDHAGASLVVDSSDRSRCILALWNPMREESLCAFET